MARTITIGSALAPENEIVIDENPAADPLLMPGDDIIVAEEMEDGSAIVSFGQTDKPVATADVSQHGVNLAEALDDATLARIAADICDTVDADDRSRDDWRKSYAEGLNLLGIKVERRMVPWPGASGVFHPVLLEAVVRFQAQAIMEMFPASGPARVQVVGKETPERKRRADRVQREMNYQLTEVMQEFRDEHEQLMFHLPLAGCGFKKLYNDPRLGRHTSVFVPADDIVIPYGYSNLMTAPRFAHILRMNTADAKLMQSSGVWRDVPLPPASFIQTDEIEDKEQEIYGTKPSPYKDDRRKIYECYIDLVIDEDTTVAEANPELVGIPVPYIVTVDRDTMNVLAIYRNWREGGHPRHDKLQTIVHYQYLPGFGAYGTSLIHLIGGLAKTATGIMRQTIDNGTKRNAPSGFRARGVRMLAEDEPLRPGELRDVDVPGAKLADGIYRMDPAELSPVTVEVLRHVIEEARRLGSAADMNISEIKGDMPVGTVLALLERNLKITSAVHARLHASMRQELKILASMIGHGPYDYEVDDESATKDGDFADSLNILPVSDPNATTTAQRMLRLQAALEMSTRAPQVYDLPLLHRSMLEALELNNAKDIVRTEDDHKPQDPVVENMGVLTGKPLKAYIHQDHRAHIAAHMAMAQDPKILELVQNAPNAQAIQAAMSAHIAEHVAFQYRAEIEQRLGATLPPPDEPLPPEIEVAMSRVVADAANKLLADNQAEMAQKKAQEQAEDPLIQIEKAKLENQRAEIERKRAKDAADAEIKKQEIAIRAQIDQERIRSAERQTGAEIGADIAKSQRQVRSKEVIEGVRLGQQAVMDARKRATEKDIAKMAADARRSKPKKGGE